MSLSRALNQLICRVLIGVFLFAQLAISSHACPVLGRSAPQGVEVQMPAGCDPVGPVDQKASASLCAEHCKSGQQNHDTSPAPVVVAPALSLLYVLSGDLRDIAASDAPRASKGPHLLAKPPPHAILHCVFRI